MGRMNKKKKTKKPTKLDKLMAENENLKKKYSIIIKAFRLSSEELYSRTVVLKSQKNLDSFRKYLIWEANK